MIKFNHGHFVQGLLAATALAFGLLAEGAVPAFAGSVSVTGANGARRARLWLDRTAGRCRWSCECVSDHHHVSRRPVEHGHRDRRQRRHGRLD
jgi:hypothetical protein